MDRYKTAPHLDYGSELAPQHKYFVSSNLDSFPIFALNKTFVRPGDSFSLFLLCFAFLFEWELETWKLYLGPIFDIFLKV